MTKGPGTFISLYTIDRMYQVRPEFGGSIDSAVSSWIDSGETRDTLLDLETMEGMELRVRASTITGWLVSTPESRRLMYRMDAVAGEERRQHRIEAGLPPDEDAGW